MNPRHKNDTAEFKDLDFQGQARAMNMTALQFRKQLKAHLRRAGEKRERTLEVRLGLLRRIIDHDWRT